MQKNVTQSVTKKDSDVIKSYGMNRLAMAQVCNRLHSTNGSISKQ